MDRCELEKDQPKELWSVPEGAVPFFSWALLEHSRGLSESV